MSRSIRLFLAIVLLVLVVVVLKASVQPRKDSIKIGALLPLSGDFASIGSEIKRGVDLGVKQLTDQGQKITVVYEDDQFDPKKTVLGANKLINIDKIDVGVVFSIEEARPIMSTFNNNKIPLVAAWDSNKYIYDAGEYIFSNGFSTEGAGSMMADYAYKDLKIKKIAIVRHVDEWSRIISDAFKEQFEKSGGIVVYDESVQVGTSDFRLQISKIKSSNPDGVYAPLIPFDSVFFIKQLRQQGLNTPILSGDSIIQDVIDAVGPDVGALYFTSVYSDNSKLRAQYKAVYGSDPTGLVFVGGGYDLISKIGLELSMSHNVKGTLDKIFGSTRSADRIEKIYQVKNGIIEEVVK